MHEGDLRAFFVGVLLVYADCVAEDIEGFWRGCGGENEVAGYGE